MEAGARSTRLRSLTISPAAFEWFAYAAFAALFLIVVSGATVRLTGSGLGCENWPNCGDTFLPPKEYNALIEFGNRGAGFTVGLTTLVAAAVAFRVPGMPRWLLWSAVALPFTVLAQGVLGGITVLLELHPLIVMGHFLLSLVALAVAVVVVQGARDLARGVADETPIGSAWLALALVPAAAALVVSGTLVTAAGPHSGGEEIVRFGNLVEAVHIHIGATAVFGIAFLALLALLVVERPSLGARAPPRDARHGGLGARRRACRPRGAQAPSPPPVDWASSQGISASRAARRCAAPCSSPRFVGGTTARRARRSPRASSPRAGAPSGSPTSIPRSSTTSRRSGRTCGSRRA
jgi:cytochrome c oxidase assembly protein subunit 15